MDKITLINAMNFYGTLRIPFLFAIDFECRHPVIKPLDEIDPDLILFDINGRTNAGACHSTDEPITLTPHPLPYEIYRQKFMKVREHIVRGDTYLLNLTMPTRVDMNATLRDVFYRSAAKYKLYLKDRCVVFSPEIFIQIADRIITSYPMKGTIDAALPDAAQAILNNPKEAAEHATIVDLIRNDLSMVSAHVRVTRYRYIDTLRTSNKTLLQVSSEITGELDEYWNHHLGDILLTMLPAGSVSGAPKTRTVEIILSTEGYIRGFYTGVAGIFDGQSLDAGVMIRYIEQTHDGYYYKSGGGITAFSDPEKEYQELLDKIYVPLS